MVRVNVIVVAGALVTGLVIKAPLACAATPMDHTRALASYSSSSAACHTVWSACAADATCLACGEAYDAAASGVCGGTFETCDELGSAVCCAADGCEDLAIFAAYIECFTAGYGCGVLDISTCTSGVGSGSDEATTSVGGETTADSTSAAVCAAEAAACEADADCLACAQTLNSVSEICEDSDYDSADATCDERLEVNCCTLEDSAADCFFDSDLAIALVDCEAEANGCDYRGSTLSTDCADGGVAEDEDSYVDSSDEDSDSKDTDVADADSATPSAMVGGTTAMILAASVSLAFASA